MFVIACVQEMRTRCNFRGVRELLGDVLTLSLFYLNGNLNETYTHNNRLYKERGTKWYNRRISEQGNQTFKSFNQFNFFNTDAAHQFSNSEEKDVINDSLKQIILGEEYTTLKDKIQKIQTRLEPELNKISRSIKDKNDEVQKNSNRINELKSSFNLSGIIVFPFNINVWWLTDLSGVVKPLVSNLFSFYRLFQNIHLEMIC